MESHIVPPRFRQAVLIHIMRNLLASPHFKPSLILGIHGPSGDGKTYQCDLVLRGLGVHVLLLSGGQLESDRAGDPARLVRETYIDASRHTSEHDQASCIVINDFDVGVGSWGESVQYTVNRQLVFAELMHLVDYPSAVAGEATRRVPIILTGNDFSRLYQPLTRPGRMTSFEWKPDLPERIEMVRGIFPELSSADCARLVTELGSKKRFLPTAFFSSLRSTLFDDVITSQMSLSPEKDVAALVRGTKTIDLSGAVSLQRCLTVGRQLLGEYSYMNHLGVR